MAGYISHNNNDGWDAENETWAEYKKRKSSKSAGMGQKKPERTKRANLSGLRTKALKRAKYKCEWANCNNKDWLELAHLVGIGMGGKNNKLANEITNVMILCKMHHDMYDGRTMTGKKREYTELLLEYLQLKYK